MATWTAEEEANYDRAITNFHAVLYGADSAAIPIDGTKAIIDRCDAAAAIADAPFTNFLGNLRKITVGPGDSMMVNRATVASRSNVLGDEVGRGSYGTIFKSSVHDVAYKKIQISTKDLVDLEAKLKGIFWKHGFKQY